MESLRAAVENGADAIYLGLKEFSARAFANNFSIQNINSITDYLHQNDKKLYIAVNTIIKEREIKKVFEYLATLYRIGVDAVIIQDLGLLAIINDYFPDLKIHASTQMSNINSLDVKFLKKYNVKRVVLERQLTFDEIKDIVKKNEAEIELFIHGALCYSFSGQCVFSSFLGGQSANRGRCTQPCRRGYVLNEQSLGYYFSPNDLSSVKNFEKLLALKIASLKIEGRMKNYQYVANVTKAYRILIDDFKQNNKISDKVKQEARELIKNSLGRKTCSGFYFKSENQIVEPKLKGATGLYIGKILETSSEFLKLKIVSEVKLGDRLRIQELREAINVKKIISRGVNVEFAKKNSVIKIPIDKKIKVKKGNTVFKVSHSENKKEYIKTNFIKIKHIKLTGSEISNREILPKERKGGKKEIYFKLNNISDINVFPDHTKDYLIIPVTNLNNFMQVRKKLNIFIDNIIFELPQFLFENEIVDVKKTIDKLIENGFGKFYIHSKSEINYFDNLEDLFVITSERFHIANSLSAKFLQNSGIKRWVVDIENDKENLFDLKLKNNSIVTLYSNYPLLISRIPNKIKNNSSIIDNKKNKFFVKNKKNLVYIYDRRNFNIIAQKKELEKQGYTKFLFDISNVKYYKSGLRSFYNSIKSDKVFSGSDFNYSMGWE